MKYFRIFSSFVYTQLSGGFRALSLLFPHFLIFLIFSRQTILLSQTFRLGHGTRQHQQPIRSAPDQTITSDNQTSLRSDHRSDHAPTTTPDHLQTRPPKSAHQSRPPPPHQTTRSDQPNRLPSLTVPLRISTAHPTSRNGTGQVHSLWVGSRGVYRALDEPCKAYFPHTFGLKLSDIFHLNLTVVRLVSVVSRSGKGLPFPFSLVGFLCSCSVSNIGSAFTIPLSFQEKIRLRFLRLFRMDSPLFFVVVVTAVSRLVAPNSIHHTSLDSHCAGQVKHSLARFNQTVIILIRNLVNQRRKIIQLQ